MMNATDGWGMGFGHGWVGILLLVLVILGILALLKWLLRK